MKNIKNKDIIEFRYKLIDYLCSERYLVSSVICTDGSNVMTPEKKKVLEDVLIEFNLHFGTRDYDLGQIWWFKIFPLSLCTKIKSYGQKNC